MNLAPTESGGMPPHHQDLTMVRMVWGHNPAVVAGKLSRPAVPIGGAAVD